LRYPRAICFNKSDTAASTTNEIWPIAMLPTFSKLYERLFLIRLNSWSVKMNILPAQKSGPQPHQCTVSRENALLDRIRQSYRKRETTFRDCQYSYTPMRIQYSKDVTHSTVSTLQMLLGHVAKICNRKIHIRSLLI
jgi:hypothetical protein